MTTFSPISLVTALAARPLSDQHWAMERFHSCMVVAHRAKENIADHERDILNPIYRDERDEFLAEIEVFKNASDLALIEAARWLEKCPLLWMKSILEAQ